MADAASLDQHEFLPEFSVRQLGKQSDIVCPLQQ